MRQARQFNAAANSRINPMTHFSHKGGVLHAEDVSIPAIAAEIGTPFYCYSSAALTDRYTALDTALARAGLDDTQICYAVKANASLAVIATLAQAGAGADIVSEGELRRALAAGVAPDKILFSGVGKTEAEITAALDAGIAQFNVESVAELETLAALAQAHGTTAKVGLRVNPDIAAGGHEKISTGIAESKFGIAWDEATDTFARAAALDGIEARGLAVHIGSQISDLGLFRAAFSKIAELLATLRAAGHNVTHLDVGGGLGVAETPDAPPPDLDGYAAAIAETLGDSGCRIWLEPGRVIAAEAGILVASVIRSKRGQGKNFVVVDAAMTELIRPTLYDAHHPIRPVVERPDAPETLWDIVGPVCESGDFLGLAQPLPELESGDLLAIHAAGAYGAVLGSSYNSRRLAPEVLVEGARFALTRPRPDYAAQLAAERMPDWLT